MILKKLLYVWCCFARLFISSLIICFYLPLCLFFILISLASSPGPFPAFQCCMLRATLKSWEWASGRGYISHVLYVYWAKMQLMLIYFACSPYIVRIQHVFSPPTLPPMQSCPSGEAWAPLPLMCLWRHAASSGIESNWTNRTNQWLNIQTYTLFHVWPVSISLGSSSPFEHYNNILPKLC